MKGNAYKEVVLEKVDSITEGANASSKEKMLCECIWYINWGMDMYLDSRVASMPKKGNY